MRELAELEIDQHEALQQTVVEDQVDEEVIAVEGQALLSTDKAKALAELEQEGLEAIDDRLLETLLAPVGPLGEAQKLEHHRILDDVARPLDLLSLPSEGSDSVLVSALGQAFEEHRADDAPDALAQKQLALAMSRTSKTKPASSTSRPR